MSLFFVALIVNLILDTVVPLSYTVVFGEIEKETVLVQDFEYKG